MKEIGRARVFEKKILLVDDDMTILNMLEVILKKEQFQNVSKARNGVEAIRIQEEIKPDIIILDIMLPDIDGYEVCKKIRNSSMVPIIFLSAKTEELDKILGYALGGDDYICKPFSNKELVLKIKAILKRQEYYSTIHKHKEYNFGKFTLSFEQQVLKKGEKIVPLTSKEYGVLEYLIINRNITVSKERLIENVWGAEYDGLDNTVMVHIRHLREKIEDVPSKPRFIKTIKGRGYLFEE